FAFIDPIELRDMTFPSLPLTRELGYTFGFFMFWAATAASSLFTWILLRPASRFNRPLPPGCNPPRRGASDGPGPPLGHSVALAARVRPRYWWWAAGSAPPQPRRDCQPVEAPADDPVFPLAAPARAPRPPSRNRAMSRNVPIDVVDDGGGSMYVKERKVYPRD